MNFNEFLFKMLDLINKSSNDINISFTPQKGHIIDILVSVYDDVIVDTSINADCFSEESKKMAKIINAISEYC